MIRSISKILTTGLKTGNVISPVFSTPTNTAPKFKPVSEVTPLCDYNSIVCLDNEQLVSQRVYHYNACIVKYKQGYRLFYRTGIEPKMTYDQIATCLLSNDFDIDTSSHKIISTYSNGPQIMLDMKLRFHGKEPIFDGFHCEDPRAIQHAGFWFLTYTDGFRMGVAKLDLDTCEMIYSHYLIPPSTFTHLDSDGREKNWIPFSEGPYVCFLYSDNPRQILRYEDKGNLLSLNSVEAPLKLTRCIFGIIRGGCSPVQYDDLHMIWFFHTAKESKYSIGAYITRGFREVVYSMDSPILVGAPQPRFQTSLVIKDNVVYPCGAVATEAGWIISMGINDYRIGLLSIQRSTLESAIPADILSKIRNQTGTNTPLT